MQLVDRHEAGTEVCSALLNYDTFSFGSAVAAGLLLPRGHGVRVHARGGQRHPRDQQQLLHRPLAVCLQEQSAAKCDCCRCKQVQTASCLHCGTGSRESQVNAAATGTNGNHSSNASFPRAELCSMRSARGWMSLRPPAMRTKIWTIRRSTLRVPITSVTGTSSKTGR